MEGTGSGGRFRIAVLQEKSKAGRLEENTAAVLSHMEEAKRHGADLLLLPECFLTGYSLPVENSQAIGPDDPYLTQVCQAARRLEIGVVVTAFTRGTERPRNTAFVVDKTGKILMEYSKVHTCDFADEACLEGGREFCVCDFHGIRLGVMICYDREYPESARILMLKGAEIILVPNDCTSMLPRVRALSTRAYENMTGVVMANPDGENGGCSCAFSPICWDREGNCIDNTIFLAGERETGIFYADFDLKELRAYREREMLGNTFRKVHAYGELLNGAVKPPFIRRRAQLLGTEQDEKAREGLE